VNRLFGETNGRPRVPAVDIKETENDLILKADMLDVDMKDIDIQVENGTLTIRGERKFDSEKKNGVLTITLPKKEVAKPRQIKVAVSAN
jgi:HSP20 family protein